MTHHDGSPVIDRAIRKSGFRETMRRFRHFRRNERRDLCRNDQKNRAENDAESRDFSQTAGKRVFFLIESVFPDRSPGQKKPQQQKDGENRQETKPKPVSSPVHVVQTAHTCGKERRKQQNVQCQSKTRTLDRREKDRKGKRAHELQNQDPKKHSPKFHSGGTSGKRCAVRKKYFHRFLHQGSSGVSGNGFQGVRMSFPYF